MHEAVQAELQHRDTRSQRLFTSQRATEMLMSLASERSGERMMTLPGAR